MIKLMDRLIRNDVVIDTIVANLAPFPLDAPSSLATLTLVTLEGDSVKSFWAVQLIIRVEEQFSVRFVRLPSAC